MVQKGTEAINGVEILRWRIDLPQLEELAEISAFYCELAARTAAFCRGALKQRAETEYEHCDDPKKRFRFPPLVYALTGRIAAREASLLSVELTVSLRRDGHLLAHRIWGQVFDLGDQVLLPPELITSMRGMPKPPKRIRKQIGALLVSEGTLWERKNGEWVPLLGRNVKKLSQNSCKSVKNMVE